MKNLEEDWEEEDVGEEGDEEEWEEEEWWPLKSPIFNHYLILGLKIYSTHLLPCSYLRVARTHTAQQKNKNNPKSFISSTFVHRISFSNPKIKFLLMTHALKRGKM